MSAVPRVIERLGRRVRAEAPEEEATLMTAALLLAGLRLNKQQAKRLYEQGVRAMRESSVYKLILDDGRSDEARRILLRIGSQRFGAPAEAQAAALQAITDLERLERMVDRVLDAADWQDLLNTP